MAGDPSDPTSGMFRQMLGGGTMIGPAGGARKPDPPVQNMTIPPQGRALLATISNQDFEGTNGNYASRFARPDITDFSKHPATRVPIQGGKDWTDAAGRYQTISTTYKEQAEKAGVTDFSPKSQDAVAWNLAQERYAQSTKGRDLTTDLNNPAKLPDIVQALHPTWSSLPGGSEQRGSIDQFNQAFQTNLQAEQARPSTGSGPAGSDFGDALRQQMMGRAMGVAT